MNKEPNINIPSREDQRTYLSIRDNDAEIVTILGTKKKYKIRWLKNGQLEKLDRLLLRKSHVDLGNADDSLDPVISDLKLGCKVAAIYVLDGYWKLKFRYWYLWRWFYYIRQYDFVQLHDLLDAGKKKIPVTQFLILSMSLIAARGTVMNLRTEEAEAIQRELLTDRRSPVQKSSNG